MFTYLEWSLPHMNFYIPKLRHPVWFSPPKLSSILRSHRVLICTQFWNQISRNALSGLVWRKFVSWEFRECDRPLTIPAIFLPNILDYKHIAKRSVCVCLCVFWHEIQRDVRMVGGSTQHSATLENDELYFKAFFSAFPLGASAQRVCSSSSS